jgi:hypothetical protein
VGGAKAPRMWFRRLFRRRREPPPVLLPSLDRLAELIERVVALLDDVALAPEPKPRPARREQRPEKIVLNQHNPGPAADGWLAFASSPDGYRLLPQEGAAPERGATIELELGRFQVLRLGPSPLPGDRRRCAFLEREEPLPAERTLDG